MGDAGPTCTKPWGPYPEPHVQEKKYTSVFQHLVAETGERGFKCIPRDNEFKASLSTRSCLKHSKAWQVTRIVTPFRTAQDSVGFLHHEERKKNKEEQMIKVSFPAPAKAGGAGLSSRMAHCVTEKAQLTGAQGGWSHELRILHILHHHCLEVFVQAKKPFHIHGVPQTCPSPASQRKNPPNQHCPVLIHPSLSLQDKP